MSAKRRLSQDLIDELRAGPLGLHVDAFAQRFRDGRYADSTLRQYLNCLIHFARWISQQHRSVEEVDEAVVAELLDWTSTSRNVGVRDRSRVSAGCCMRHSSGFSWCCAPRA
ncbi:site-specific integrase [Thiorhodococcus minor]|uniref:Core-binding (CB) domain-containing protein n=1 Tax=Thiorhodococcus minor TaxID=57489 RepID=A0A6M0K5G3_9GAMM|nr:site-specific integrase [Thiorhodococcus minor]NEV64960.1 hypothetical protein [Thiorhodococcus minor]